MRLLLYRRLLHNVHRRLLHNVHRHLQKYCYRPMLYLLSNLHAVLLQWMPQLLQLGMHGNLHLRLRFGIVIRM